MANWKYARIGDVCTVERGGSPRPIDRFITVDPNGINWIKIGDTDDSMYITKTAQKIIPEGMKKSRYVQPGDFLLSNSMSFGRPYILKIDGCIHDGWLVLRDNDGIFDKRFLYYYLSAPSTYQKFKNMAVGGVVNNLNSEMVRGVTVPVPTMEEQLNIVSVLDKVTELIALRKEQLAKLDQLVKSRFVELFGNIDECENKLELQDICLKITDGSHNPPSGIEKSQNYMISSQNIHDNIIDYKDVRYLSDSDFENENKRTAIMPGDVLLTIVGAIGRSAVAKDDLNITCQRSVCVIHPNRDKVNSIFLKYMLDSISDKIINEARGAAQKGIYLNQVKKLQIICPSFDFQSQFATFVEQTDKSKLAIQQSLDKLELLKKSLMQEYFG